MERGALDLLVRPSLNVRMASSRSPRPIDAERSCISLGGASKLREGSCCALTVCAQCVAINHGSAKQDKADHTSVLACDEDEILGCAKPEAFLFASCISKAAF